MNIWKSLLLNLLAGFALVGAEVVVALSGGPALRLPLVLGAMVVAMIQYAVNGKRWARLPVSPVTGGRRVALHAMSALAGPGAYGMACMAADHALAPGAAVVSSLASLLACEPAVRCLRHAAGPSNLTGPSR